MKRHSNVLIDFGLVKKVIKRNTRLIIGIFIGLLIAGIGVKASTILSGSEVLYDNSNSNSSSNNVQGAIEELYKKSNKCTTGSCSLTESNFIIGYTYNQEKSSANYCVTGDEVTCVRTDCYTSSEKTCPAGTIIDYIVNGTNNRVRFHVMYDEGKKITMQSQKNIIRSIPWYSPSQDNTKGPLTVLSQLEDVTGDWLNVEDQSYTLGETVFKDNAFTGCSSNNEYELICSKNLYVLSPKTVKARMITVQEASNFGCLLYSGKDDAHFCPIWMYNFIYDSTSHGGTVADNETNSSGNYNYGYWTASASLNSSTHVFFISRFGNIDHGGSYHTASSHLGARAVVVVSK